MTLTLKLADAMLAKMANLHHITLYWKLKSLSEPSSKVGVLKCKLAKFFRIIFQQSEWKGLWDIRRTPLTLYNLGVIMEHTVENCLPTTAVKQIIKNMYIWKSPFMTLWTPDFDMDQHA
jgi:hypothetical protein